MEPINKNRAEQHKNYGQLPIRHDIIMYIKPLGFYKNGLLPGKNWRSRKMNVKRITVFLVLAFVATGLGFTQQSISRTSLRCTRLLVEGQDHTRNVRSVSLNLYPNNTSMLTFYFHNGNSTSYHFSNGRRNSNGTLTSDVSLQTHDGQFFHGYYAISAESSGLLTFGVYDKSNYSMLADIVLRTE